MEVAMSAVVGELVSQFNSFLMNKCKSLRHAQSEEEKVLERLQHLLMRAGTIVEEADRRYITNSGMMMQLKTLSEAMYRGYGALDNSRYRALQDNGGFDEVSINDSSGSGLYLVKRCRTTNDKATCLESHDALESLEIAIANMAEFIVLPSGCERMYRRPYDVYLYTDNFMFGRHTEKQKLLSFLLQHNDPTSNHALAVLPIIGGVGVGKKTLVAHACGDERVRSRFSSIFQLNGDSLLTILDNGKTMEGMMLVVIEYASDVDDDEWKRFHSFFIRMGKGNKIIIISKLKRLARFGSVKPIFLTAMSYDELRYLLKTLALGSVDPTEHPRLVQIADEFAMLVHNAQCSLTSANVFADMLRKNLHIQFWRSILDKGIRYVKRNLSRYSSVDSAILIQQGHPVVVTDLALDPLSVRPYTNNVSSKKLPSATFGELLTDPTVGRKGDFIIVSWESRIPPHNSFACFATSHAQDTHEGCTLPGRKRRGEPI
ncbi:putative disease resistance RPP13-like protein 1 [Aegilops tauschii subsp. strangulata]|uniref:putative disease resistance RPP13-like protein 1 n=1 Tax=Aegilops tauschii subsp. strangulata TaxID=200361 RepID=UPI00098A0AA5|nr:putative disease resistance RPP13-like protein 1 [Aegilops tauschii subsp. strangulata]